MPGYTSRKLTAAGVIVATLGLGLSACGDHHDKSSPTPGTTTTASAPTSTPLKVRTVKVTGRFPASRRDRLRKAVGRVVDAWWRQAYLSRGGDPFGPSFTKGAAKLAGRDVSLMSNRKDGAVGTPVARRREVDLDVFTVKGKAVGVTAALHLTYDTTASPERRCTVGGTVSLRPVAGAWRIFGYDVDHSCGPKQKAAHRTQSPSKSPSKTASPSHTSKSGATKKGSKQHSSKRGGKKGANR